MRSRIAIGLIALASLTSLSHASFVDTGVIGVSLDFPSEPGPQGTVPYYRLAGQSVFFSQRTSSSTTGGQLDGVTSFDSASAVHEVTFAEVFPEANLTDYLTYGYFGVLEKVAPDGETVLDRSLVLASKLDYANGLHVEDIFPTLTEATLVNALVTSNDSAEFFAALAAAQANANLSGDTALRLAGVGQVRPGSSLTLYGFVTPSLVAEGSDTASDVGFIDFAVTRTEIPEPAGLAVVAPVAAFLTRRRRA